MNKKKHLKYNLNTINIGSRRDSSHSSSKQHIPLSKQHILLQPQPQPHYPVTTLQYPQKPEEQEEDLSFNDSKLMQYGKSQTLKESQFNRIRVHVYRKEKQSKWSELTVHHPASIDRHYLQTIDDHTQELEKRKERKTVLVRRKLIDPSASQTKIKASSTDRKKYEHPRGGSAEQMLKVNRNLQHSLRDKGQESADSSPLQKSQLDKMLNEISLKVEQQKNKAERSREKQRNISQTSNIRRRLAKLEMKRFVMPFRFRQPRRHVQKQPVKDQPLEQSPKDDFKAWEYVDAFNSSKHGIEEYTLEESIEPKKSTSSPKRQTPSRKKKIKSQTKKEDTSNNN